jgi:hypothetical protein
MKTIRTIWFCVATLIVTTSGLIAADWQVVYQTDFSSNPGWTTDDPAKLSWDSATGTFHGTQVNTEGTYAVKQITGIDNSKAWRLEFDSKINTNQWSAGLTLGLFDSRLQYPYGHISDMGQSDGGQCTALVSSPASTWTNSPAWTTGTWYHTVMEYNPSVQQITSNVFTRSTGELFLSLTTGGVLFSGEANYLGVSRLHMKNNAPGAWGGATVDYNIDNITVQQIPEPATLLLLGLGGLALRRGRK